MSVVRSLRIRLGEVDVGSLFGLDDGRVYFHVDDAYALNPARPVLSQLYLAETEDATRTQLLSPTLAVNRGPGNGRLPPFFRGLLPEGRLRKHLLADAGLPPDDELGLLSYCGTDLPGNVYALREQLDEPALGRLICQGRDAYEMSSGQLPTPQAQSISGVQPKVALVEAPGGRYVMRSKDDANVHFIGKLPASDYPRLPEVEFAAMALARAAGVDTCHVELKPLHAIAARLPFELREDDRQFLLVRRFDRDAPTRNGRLHMEDMAQAQGIDPDAKYDGTYAALGLALRIASADGRADLLELVRRIKVNELLGNYDAHLKNFSLLYADPRAPRLAPAYDIVAYAAYLGGRGHALKFVPGQVSAAALTPAVLRQLANAWDMPELPLRAAVQETVDRAMTQWPALLAQLPLAAAQREAIWAHAQGNPSAQAWARRQRPETR